MMLFKVYKNINQISSKSPVKGIKILMKKKNDNMAMNDIRISQKLKNKGWLSIEKEIMKCEKIKIYCKQLFL